MTALDLDAIKARLAALSDFDEEEWQVWYNRETKEPVSVGPDNFTECFVIDGMSEADAQFVAESPEMVRALVAEVERLRAAADGLNDVLLHWRDRAAGYMDAPPFKSNSMTRGSMAYERAAGLVRDLRDGKLDAAEIERLTHFGEDGPCTAYDYRDREPSGLGSTGGEL